MSSVVLVLIRRRTHCPHGIGAGGELSKTVVAGSVCRAVNEECQRVGGSERNLGVSRGQRRPKRASQCRQCWRQASCKESAKTSRHL